MKRVNKGKLVALLIIIMAAALTFGCGQCNMTREFNGHAEMIEIVPE